MPTSLDCSRCPPFDPASQRTALPEIVGESPAIERLRIRLHRLGPHFRTVLLRGERGTGKELVARTLHRLSAHAAGPFLIYRSTAKPNVYEGLATNGESFANMMKLAHRGTLYLDQIHEMAAEKQAALLAFLQSIERNQREPILVRGLEARIVASTTVDLGVLATSSRFMRALYDRLAAVEIELPPLRERAEDISLLAESLKARCGQCLGCGVGALSSGALAIMHSYRWPGNVQELKIVLRRALIESQGGVIETKHLALPLSEPDRSGFTFQSAPLPLQDVVEQYVFKVLNGCAGNKLKAAEVLGISRSTLYRMLDSGSQRDETTA